MKNVHFLAPLDDAGEFLTMTDDEVAAATFENVTFATDESNLAAIMEQGGAIPAGISAGGSSAADISKFQWTWAHIAGGLDF